MQRTRSVRGPRAIGGSGIPPTFFAPLNDLGAGAVNQQIMGTGSATFTRATTAWTKLSTGLWVAVATGVARSGYLVASTAVGVYGGYFNEPARTNQCLQSRDRTNASWSNVNVTAAKDQTGIDGVGNSCSSLTATAIGGTSLQAITEAATLSAYSVFIKRITGAGTITIQQGASTLEVSGSLNSVTFTRVEIDATVLNPLVGIVFGTSGDKIAVDMDQFENGNGGVATSPIPTTTVAVTRNADTLTYPLSGNIIDAAGTISCQFNATITGAGFVLVGDSGSNAGLAESNGNTIVAKDGTSTPTTAASGVLGNTQKGAMTWVTGGNMNAYINGGNKATSAYDGSMFVTDIEICTRGGSQIGGCIRGVNIYPAAFNDAQIAAQ